ncbi:zinc finger protein 43-like isoform X2 [Artemia franciscana]|uniref:zinc finger protein 43-like isoform X2 n=1 Tax=Artemia franciscana TaxID=6661 RepID=UPI0032DBA3F5
MEQREVCLKWNDYLDVFHGAFLSVLDIDHFTDVTLLCDSHSINCHRLVLSSSSSFFETLLLGISHSHPIIIVKDVEFHDLQALVEFMYTGEVTVPKHQTSSLVKVAEMFKVKGLAYPDVIANQIQKPSYLSQNSQITQPAVKGNRVVLTSDNKSLTENFSSNLEPPVADTSNGNLVNSPAETSSSVYPTDNAACNSLQVKTEFAASIDKGGSNSSDQFADDGGHFDYGSETLVRSRILERRERKPNASLNLSEVEDASSRHNEEIVGVPDPHLFLSGEDITLGNFPGFSGNCQLQLDTEESDATSFDSQVPGFPSSIIYQGKMPTRTFRRGVRPKAFYCTACNKGFTSIGRLRRHYSTNIHQNAVKYSGLPDPARKKKKLKAGDTTALSQASLSPSPGSPELSTSSGDETQFSVHQLAQCYEDSLGTLNMPTASQGQMSPEHFRQDFQSVSQQGHFYCSNQNNFKETVRITSNLSVTTSNTFGFTGTNGNGPSNLLRSNNSEFSQVIPFSTENTSTNSTTNGTYSTSTSLPVLNQSPANGPQSHSDLPHFQSQASQYASESTQSLRCLESFALGPIYSSFSSTYNQDDPNFCDSALPPNSQVPPSEGTRGAKAKAELKLKQSDIGTSYCFKTAQPSISAIPCIPYNLSTVSKDDSLPKLLVKKKPKKIKKKVRELLVASKSELHGNAFPIEIVVNKKYVSPPSPPRAPCEIPIPLQNEILPSFSESPVESETPQVTENLPYDEANLGFNNNNTLAISGKLVFGRVSGSSDGNSSTAVNPQSKPASRECFPANIFSNFLTEADVSAITGGGKVIYRCSYCDKNFNCIRYLTKHCNSYHRGDRPFNCEVCGKRFCDEEYYKFHQSIHVGSKP